MKIAFSIWNDRIAPVFDTSCQVNLIEVKNEKIVSRQKLDLVAASAVDKISALQQAEVKVIICGAVSRLVQEQLEAAGIEVVPFVSGDLNSVIAGWLDKSLNTDNFAMPGCCGRRRGCCGGVPGKGRRINNGRGRGLGKGSGRLQ